MPENIRKAAREMGQRAFKEKLREIKMSEYDAKLYDQFYSSVSQQVQALRVILNSLQAKSRDRQWLRHQTTGELDDGKLIEGESAQSQLQDRDLCAPVLSYSQNWNIGQAGVSNNNVVTAKSID